MRAVRGIMGGYPRRIPLSAMVHHPWSYRGHREKGFIDGPLRGQFCDVRTWAHEGLVNELVAAGYYVDGGTPESAYRWLKEETERQVALWLYCWVPGTVEDFTRDLALARRLGAPQMLFWEADYIDLRPELERERIAAVMGEA